MGENTTKPSSNETYGFDAIRGVQARREFYVAICALKIIPKLFIFNENDIPPELRAQRVLRESRIPALKNYILNNPTEYTFSSLTASVDGKMNFIPATHLGPDGKLGRLYINMDARMVINDGQHRRKAIEEALKENPDLGHEAISVVFFADNGLTRSQQMFADLNKNAVKPSKSLNILYDRRDAYSRFIVDVIKEIDVFKDRVELEKTTIGNHAKEFFTLGGISDATKKLLGKSKILRLGKGQKTLIREFWECVAKNMPEWQLVLQNRLSADDLRANYVNAHTNCLNSLGLAGKIIVNSYPDKWKQKLSALRNIDWSRENPEWSGRLLQGKQMVRTTAGVTLGANMILRKCNVKIPKEMRELES